MKRIRAYVLAGLAFLIAMLVVPLTVLASAPAQTGGVVLVIAPPWADAGGVVGVVAAASGRVIGPEVALFGVLAVAGDPQDLRTQGAWAVLDGRAIAMLCGVPTDAAGTATRRIGI